MTEVLNRLREMLGLNDSNVSFLLMRLRSRRAGAPQSGVFRCRCRIALPLLFFGIQLSLCVHAAEWSYVVAGITPGAEAKHAKLVVGDLIAEWQETSTSNDSQAAWRAVDSVWTLKALERTCVTPCTVRLRGFRNGEPRTWYMQAGDWALDLRPAFDNAADDRILVRLSGSIDSGSREPLTEPIVQRALQLSDVEPDLAGWIVAQLFVDAVRASDWETALAYGQEFQRQPDGDFHEALSLAMPWIQTSAPDRFVSSVVNQLDALKISEDVSPENGIAVLVVQLQLMAILGNSKSTGEFASAALETVRLAAPGSVSHYRAEMALGRLRSANESPAVAERHFRAALAHLESWHGSRNRLQVLPLSYLGRLAALQGNTDTAEQLLTEAMTLAESLRDDRFKATPLEALGLLNMLQGDVYKAEYHYQKALSLNERYTSKRAWAWNLLSLSDIAYHRGDFRAGVALVRRAIERLTELEPSSTKVAYALTRLASMHLGLEEKGLALSNYDKARSLYLAQAPESLGMSMVELSLGAIAADDGAFEVARKHMRRAIELREKLVPNGIHLAESYQFMASIEEDAGELRAARVYANKALSILDMIAPGGALQAQAHYLLAHISQALGAGRRCTVALRSGHPVHRVAVAAAWRHG